jgi:ceramide glucosyltransferase
MPAGPRPGLDAFLTPPQQLAASVTGQVVMSFWFVVALVAIGIPAIVVASYPIHAAIVLRRSRAYPTGLPAASISIIVPVKGLDEGRAFALAQLMAQRTNGSVEWLFCVEEPSDPALAGLHGLTARHPDRARILITGPSGQRLGKLHNLIEGVAAARGEWLVFVDSDTILPHARYLQHFTAPLHDPRVGLVTCFPAYRRARGIPAFLLSSAINHDLLGYFALESVWGGLKLANGPCMAIRRALLQQLGGFAPQARSLLMDVILAQRVHQAGYRVLVHHEPVEVPCRAVTWRVWWNQAHRWQVGMARVLSGWFYAWYAWMRTAFPVALLAWPFLDGPVATVLAAAAATRLVVMVIMAQGFVRDPAQLRYVWLLPVLDCVTAVGCWYALLQRRVEWRGRTYRVTAGGVSERLA